MDSIDHEAGTAGPDLRVITGSVKWFNTVKGFGFVTVDDRATDAFLHLSVLRDSGYESPLPGATITCEIAEREKGLQVLHVLAVDNSTAEPVAEPVPDTDPRRSDLGEAGAFVAARVKWFNPVKGYGFLSDTEMEKDVFIHMVTLRRSGLDLLEPGQEVEVRIAEGPKGPQATDIRSH